MNKITRIAKEIITVLHSLYEKYKIPIDTTLKTLAIVFLSRYLPKSWWTSTPLNWSISSQTTLIGITTALILILGYRAESSELRRQISILTSRRRVSPEEAAEGYSKTNKLTLHAYQVEGQHRTPGHAWGMFTVSGITDLIFTTETFDEDPPLYRRGDKNMIRIVAEL